MQHVAVVVDVMLEGLCSVGQAMVVVLISGRIQKGHNRRGNQTFKELNQT